MRKTGLVVMLILFGAAIGAACGAAWAQARGPLWTYHNGNTLQAQSEEYRRGFFIGVVDGYLQGHRDRVEKADDGMWLADCLTSGWTLKRADRELAERFQKSIPLFPNPAAAIALKNLRDACADK